MVTGDHWTNAVPPLRTVQLDSQPVVGAEAPRRVSPDQTAPLAMRFTPCGVRFTPWDGCCTPWGGCFADSHPAACVSHPAVCVSHPAT
eukprot:7851089-Pyramimonas_sp.AAC.1